MKNDLRRLLDSAIAAAKEGRKPTHLELNLRRGLLGRKPRANA